MEDGIFQVSDRSIYQTGKVKESFRRPVAGATNESNTRSAQQRLALAIGGAIWLK